MTFEASIPLALPYTPHISFNLLTDFNLTEDTSAPGPIPL